MRQVVSAFHASPTANERGCAWGVPDRTGAPKNLRWKGRKTAPGEPVPASIVGGRTPSRIVEPHRPTRRLFCFSVSHRPAQQLWVPARHCWMRDTVVPTLVRERFASANTRRVVFRIGPASPPPLTRWHNCSSSCRCASKHKASRPGLCRALRPRGPFGSLLANPTWDRRRSASLARVPSQRRRLGRQRIGDPMRQTQAAMARSADQGLNSCLAPPSTGLTC